jgi:cobalt-precorrin 5A hydrolase
MTVRIVSYSRNGAATARRVYDALTARGHSCRRFALPKFCEIGDEPLTVSASEWAKDGFQGADALIFCCASGIAVRAIAPWVQSKTTDPAVLVLDERGTFVIPLLSGHIGGANALALALAETLPATPVVTTATDVNGLFAVDEFAARNHLHISDMALCKEISAALLAGEPVGFRSDVPAEGPLPNGLTEGEARFGVYVTNTDGSPFERTLRLVPQRFVLGVGCRKGKDADEMDAFVQKQLAACSVRTSELRCMASIDLKKNEPALLAFSKRHALPFLTYTAEQLNAVQGSFSGSAFVRETTGTDCVCERAALLAGGDTLVQTKIAEDGMTFALAKTEEGISFV